MMTVIFVDQRLKAEQNDCQRDATQDPELGPRDQQAFERLPLFLLKLVDESALKKVNQRLAIDLSSWP